MATLEKIRRRSVLLLVVIAVALLAFIVGDALTNSRNIFGNRTTVAEVGGTKIDIMDYQAKRAELSEMLEAQRRYNPQAANYDSQILAQAALEQLIGETLLKKAVNKMGITVNGDLLRYYMLENPINQNLGVLIQRMQGAGIPVQTPEQAWQAIFNPQTVGQTEKAMEPYKAMWLQLEAETREQVAQMTYQRLLQGTFGVNKLDKKLLADGYNTVTNIEFAMLPYGQLDEKKYPVSDADLQSAYKAHKNRYKVDETTKTVSVIRMDVAPSQKDIAASQALAEQVAKELRGAQGSVGKDSRHQGVGVKQNKLRAVDIKDEKIKNFVASAPADSILVISNDASGFEIVKMGSRTATTDSIQINVIQVAGATLPAKVLAGLNAGLSIDSVGQKFGNDSVMVQKEQWIPLYTAEGPTDVPQATIDSLENAGGRYVIINSSAQGAVIAKVVTRNAPVNVYEYDLISYQLKPSQATRDAAHRKLDAFLAKNNTAAKFAENAAKEGFNVSTYDFTQSTPAVPIFEGMNQYLPDSRQVIRWAMIDGKKGKVSKIYESSDAYAPKYYAAAVMDEFDEYYPVNHRYVKESLTEEVRRDKAGDAMVKQYQGKGNVAQVAAAMKVEPQNGIARFARIAPGPISDPKVLGAITGSKAGSNAVVVKGNDGVYVYTVKSVNKEKLNDETMFEQQFMQFLNPDLQKMLIGKNKIKNTIYKFEAGE